MKIPGRPAAAAALSTAAVVAALLVPTSASAVAPGAPTGLSPNDTSSTQYKNLELHWAAVAGADSYEIQISDDGDFDRGSTVTQTSANPSWTVPATLPAGDWAWRVRAVTGGAKGAWTAAEFSRGWSDAPAWQKSSVAPGSQGTSFSWQAIPDASFYEVEVARANLDGSNPFDGETAGIYQGTRTPHWTCYTAHAYLAPYASSTDEADLPGDEAKCFVASIGNAPPNAVGSPFYLGGTAVQIDASGSTDLEGDDIVSYTFDFGDGSPKVTQLDPLSPVHTYPRDGQYTGTVTATDAGGAVSDPGIVQVALPSAVSKSGAGTEPSDDDVNLGRFISAGTYFWRVRGRDGTLDKEIETFKPSTNACSGVWLEPGLKKVPGGFTYIWGSHPPKEAATPECSSWSSTSPITLGYPTTTTDRLTAAPAGLRTEPTLGSPDAPVVSVTDAPLLSWAAVPGAKKYRVYVSRTADMRSDDHVYETSATSLQPVSSWADRSLKTYWTVQACSLNIACGPVSSPHSFVKDSRVTISRTDTDVDRNGRRTTLTWRTLINPAAAAADQVAPLSTEAKAYQVQVALEGDWGTPVLDTKTDRLADSSEAGLSHLTLDTAAYADGRYDWRVRPIDQADHPGKWTSDTGTFLRDTVAPTGQLTGAASFSGTDALTVSFSEPVVGADTSTVAVVAGSTGRKVPGVLTATGTKDFSFTPSAPWVANETYSLGVSPVVKDRAGKSASAVKGLVRALSSLDSTSAALTKRMTGGATLKVRTASDAVGKSFLATPDKGGRGTVVLTGVLRGRYLSVQACKSPRSGQLSIGIDGKRVATVDLYRAYSGCQTVWTSKRQADRQHTVQIASLPSKNKKSKGTAVSVDALSAR